MRRARSTKRNYVPFRMLRLLQAFNKCSIRTISLSQTAAATSKLDRYGFPLETIPEWRDENVDVG